MRSHKGSMEIFHNLEDGGAVQRRVRRKYYLSEREGGKAMSMKGFVKGMLLGAAAGAAADLVMHTGTVKKTPAGKAMQTATDAVDAAAASVKETMHR